MGDTCELIKRLDRFKVREAARAKEKDELSTAKAELEEARKSLADLEAGRIEERKRFEADLEALRKQRDEAAAERDLAFASEKSTQQLLGDSEAEVRRLKTALETAEREAITRFRDSEEFSKLQTDYAVDWVLDCVAQCRRLCRQNLGPGPYRFLREEEVVKVVEAKRSSRSVEDEDDEDDGDTSGEEEPAASSEPTPSSAPAADLPSANLPADTAV
jgi:vacuolar-type H+-ATPase subunit I/STV1